MSEDRVIGKHPGLAMPYGEADATAKSHEFRARFPAIVDFYSLVAANLRARGISDWGTPAIADVATERYRQRIIEGFDEKHDDSARNAEGELAVVAACYALPSHALPLIAHPDHTLHPSLWPKTWSQQWWKPGARRRDLVKAAALLLAEIERLDRREARIEINDQDMTRERT